MATNEKTELKAFIRFKREEIKIQAWENHQKAKTEAEMRRVEVSLCFLPDFILFYFRTLSFDPV